MNSTIIDLQFVFFFLPAWLKQAKESQITELKSFANGIRRDYAAVQAACSLSWSNGSVEGNVNA